MNIPDDFELWEGPSPLDLVADFHHAFGHPIATTPITNEVLLSDLTERRMNWMREELDEAQEAIDACDVVKFCDAIGDLLYFVYGTALTHGIPLERVFNAIHDANMAKLGADGKPIYRASDGKVQKPEGWVGPENAISSILTTARFNDTPFA